MLKEIIKRALLGFMIGVFIGQTILILESLGAGDGNFYAVSPYLAQQMSTQISAVIFQYIMTGIIGLTFSAGSIIFELDNWSYTAQTALHFVLSSVVMYFSGFFCGWFPHKVSSTIVWFATFIIIYIIMWVSFTLYYRRKTDEINETLKEHRR